MLDHINDLNEVLYCVADTPPPPFSRVVSQRDFVMFRSCRADRRSGLYSVVLRNGNHHSKPPVSGFTRGESIGCVGYVVRRLHDTDGCELSFSTAADLKGRIPQWLVNFVAKRTPTLWTDRIKRMVRENYLGEPPLDTTKRIRDWKG